MTTAKTVPASALYSFAALALVTWTAFGIAAAVIDWDDGQARVLVLALLSVAHMATTAYLLLSCTRRILAYLTKSGLIFTEAYDSGHRNGFEAGHKAHGLAPEPERRHSDRRVIDLDERGSRRRLS